MEARKTFQVFFSYARADFEAEPRLVKALTEELEQRINLNLAYDRVQIWRDMKSLRLGDKWKPKIEEELRRSDVLVIMLTPSWLRSENCRSEYSIFEEIERQRSPGAFTVGYVAIILAREIRENLDNLTSEQAKVLTSIQERQYQRLLALDFLLLSQPKRTRIINEIADDIMGIIERRRTSFDLASTLPVADLSPKSKEPDVELRPLNYDEGDFISNAEVLLDQGDVSGMAIFAQIDFVRRLYIQTERGRLEFGIRRAFLQISNDGPGELEKVRELKGSEQQVASYITLHHAPPGAIGVRMDPAPGRRSLGEMALPTAQNENYFSRIATATNEVKADRLKAEVRVSLNADGLYVAETQANVPSPKMIRKIKAIINVLLAKIATKESFEIQDGIFRRSLRVTDRKGKD